MYLGGGQRKRVNQWMLEFSAGHDTAALDYLYKIYPAESAERIVTRLVDKSQRRNIGICKSCEPHMQGGMLQTYAPNGTRQARLCDYVVDPVHVWNDQETEGGVSHRIQERFEEWASPHGAPVFDSVVPSLVLGFSVEEFAAPVACLTDSEEMVVALIHPLVQVYTIPKTGQLAYVGHVCNFRQKVAQFVSSLPILPQDMPFVMVRPRLLKGCRTKSAPFKIDVFKVKKAFEWLRLYNPYYRDIIWDQKAEEAWQDEDLQIGSTREEDFDLKLLAAVGLWHFFVGWNVALPMRLLRREALP